MRLSLVLIAGGAVLAGCVPMPQGVYVPEPVPDARDAMPPVGVTIVQANDDRVLVSTNQPAHVAVFEIVPERGVRLLYPVSPRQRQAALSGSGWLTTVPGQSRDDRAVRGDRYDRVLDRATVRYLYALASEAPLRLPDAAFDDDRLAAMLGGRAARATDPYETMAALSRRFVAPGPDEAWGEDLYAIDAARRAPPVRVAKVYCPDGSVVYVRDEDADGDACPWSPRGRGRGATPPRADSVVSSTGRRVAQRPQPRMRPSAFRVPRPAAADTAAVRQAGTTTPVGGQARGDSAIAGRRNDRERALPGRGTPIPVKSEPTVERPMPVVADSQPAPRKAGNLWTRAVPATPAPKPADAPRAEPAPVAPATATPPAKVEARPDSTTPAPRRLAPRARDTTPADSTDRKRAPDPR